MTRKHLVLPTLLLTSAAFGQVTVPSAAATAKPNPQSFNGTTFYGTTSTTILHDSHTQFLYDTTDIAPAVTTWNSLAVRRPQGLGNANPVTTTTATIVLAVGPNNSSTATNNFATNLGSTPTTVFSGPLSLPAATNPATWPAPWQTPFPFSTPFIYVAATGSALVVDILQVGNTATTPWYLEATGPDVGTRAENGGAQSTCKFSNGNYNNSLGYSSPRLGANWSLTYSSILPNAIGVGAIGGSGVGGTWGGIPLPIDLTSLGAPGCKWSVSADFTVNLTASATGSASWAAIPIPNNPALGGGVFYDHAAFLDPAANSWGVVTTWSSKWIIGTNIGAPGATIAVSGNTAATATTGSLSKGTVTTLQLQ